MKRLRIAPGFLETDWFKLPNIFDYIEIFNCRSRRHSHLVGIHPEAFETAVASGEALSSRPGIVQYDLPTWNV